MFNGCLRVVGIGFGAFLGFVALIVFLAAIGSNTKQRIDATPATPAPPKPAPELGLMPEAEDFFKAHTEFGEPTKVEPLPNWLDGPRQRVQTATGKVLVIYAKDGKVITVYDHAPGQEKKKVWGEFSKY